MLHESAITESVRSKARLGTSVAFFLDGLVFATWVTRIPAVQEKLGMRNAVLGLALLMVSLGALLTMPLVGRLVHRVGSAKVVAAAVGSFGIFLIFPSLVKGVIPLGCALFVFGVGFGAVNVSSNAQAVSVERAYGRPIMASFHALFSLGGIIGGLVGSAAAGWQVQPMFQFGLVAVIAVVGAGWIRRMLIADPVLREADPREAGHASKSLRLILLGAIAYCSMFGEGAMADWSAVFLRQVSMSRASTAALGFSGFSVSMTVGRLIADRLTLAIGPVWMVRLGGGLAAGGVLLAMLLPGTVTAIAGFAMVGAGLSSLVPTIFSAAGRVGGVAPSVAIATVSTIGYFGFLSGPPLIGMVSGLVSLRYAVGFVFVAGVVVIGLARYVRAGRGLAVSQPATVGV